MKQKRSKLIPMHILNKRGDMWLSWVLLVAFSVVLGTVTSIWLQGVAEDTTDNVEDTVEVSDVCDAVAVSIDFVCQYAASPKDLNMNITNRKDLKIDKFMARLYNGNDFKSTTEVHVALKPQAQKNITVNTSSTVIDYVEFVPLRVNTVKNKTIICTDQLAKATVRSC